MARELRPLARHVVAGAAGFLGSHLCDRLLRDGAEVVGIDNLITGAGDNLAQARASPRFRFLRQDVTEPLGDIPRPDFVWNLASPASPPDYQKNPIATLRVGAVGTENLARLAMEHGARFLLASTSEVYGDPLVSPQPEEYWGNVNPIGARSMYDEAKRYAEALTMAYGRALGLEVRIARIFNTYGPRMRLDDGRVVPNFIGQALRAEPLTIYGDGSQTRSFCYVDDQIDGLVRLMMGSHIGPINIGNPREMTMLELAAALENVVGRRLPFRHRPLPSDDPKQRCPDITKARTLLGWEPSVGLEEGLRLTLESFQKGR